MLVLTRKESERIVIGQSIVITVVRVDGGKVRLGIEAPRTIPILRDEIIAQGVMPYLDAAPTARE
jgi:carbon storage regulator